MCAHQRELSFIYFICIWFHVIWLLNAGEMWNLLPIKLKPQRRWAFCWPTDLHDGLRCSGLSPWQSGSIQPQWRRRSLPKHGKWHRKSHKINTEMPHVGSTWTIQVHVALGIFRYNVFQYTTVILSLLQKKHSRAIQSRLYPLELCKTHHPRTTARYARM